MTAWVMDHDGILSKRTIYRHQRSRQSCGAAARVGVVSALAPRGDLCSQPP
jgi:hypothetical protein